MVQSADDQQVIQQDGSPPGWRWLPEEAAYGWWDGSALSTRARWDGAAWAYGAAGPPLGAQSGQAPPAPPPAPLGTGSSATPGRDRGPRRRRRRWPWIVGAIVIALLLAIGLNAAIEQGDTYSQDLTTPTSAFPARDFGTYTTRYAPDGMHLVLRAPDTLAPVGTEAPTEHTVLSVEIVASMRSPGPDAGIGPFCWQDVDHGFGLVLDRSGAATLVQIAGGSVRALRRAATAPVVGSRTVRLMVTCSRRGLLGQGIVDLTGYVDGRKVVSAASTATVSSFHYTGFAGHTVTSVPAEWVVSHFWRLGPDAAPR